jgi:hypothetical protein
MTKDPITISRMTLLRGGALRRMTQKSIKQSDTQHNSICATSSNKFIVYSAECHGAFKNTLTFLSCSTQGTFIYIIL